MKALLLEVIVQSADDARAAEAGGADRLEVVREIERDGLTPDVEVVRRIRAATRLPLRVMVRETNTFTVSGPAEMQALQRAIAAFAALGVDGAVLGFARDGRVDVETTRQVLEAAPGLAATFHRAFDALPDPLAAIDAVAGMPQIDRILTSGGTGSWMARCQRLRQFGDRAGDRLGILAGGGVDEEGLQALAASRCVREAHVGRMACEPQRPGAPVAAARVSRLRELAGRR